MGVLNGLPNPSALFASSSKSLCNWVLRESVWIQLCTWASPVRALRPNPQCCSTSPACSRRRMRLWSEASYLGWRPSTSSSATHNMRELMVHCTSFQTVNQRCPIPASTEALAHALLNAIDALTEVFHVEDVRGDNFQKHCSHQSSPPRSHHPLPATAGTSGCWAHLERIDTPRAHSGDDAISPIMD